MSSTTWLLASFLILALAQPPQPGGPTPEPPEPTPAPTPAPDEPTPEPGEPVDPRELEEPTPEPDEHAMPTPDPAAPCCFDHPHYSGSCKVTPVEDETCASILDYLNDQRSVGKTYCNYTDIRGGWAPVQCVGR